MKAGKIPDNPKDAWGFDEETLKITIEKEKTGKKRSLREKGFNNGESRNGKKSAQITDQTLVLNGIVPVFCKRKLEEAYGTEEVANNTISNSVTLLLKKDFIIPSEYTDSDDFKMFLYLIRDYRLDQWYFFTEEGCLFRFSEETPSEPSLFWFNTPIEQVESYIDQCASLNPAKDLWIAPTNEQLNDSVFSPKIDPNIHPATELKLIISNRAIGINSHDSRAQWLITTENNRVFLKQQLLERVNIDDTVLLLRDTLRTLPDGELYSRTVGSIQNTQINFSERQDIIQKRKEKEN